MSTKARLIRQFGHPRGATGRLAGWVMAHRSSNRQRNRWAVSLLDPRPTDRVLEIGFGPGIAIAEFARRITHGHVYGVDHSAVMVRVASRRNRAAIRDGRVELVHASVDQLPPFTEPFDAILAVNTLAFWADPVQRLRELRQMLRPGGRMALVRQPRVAATGDLRELLSQAGFAQLQVEILNLDPPVTCVLATR